MGIARIWCGGYYCLSEEMDGFWWSCCIPMFYLFSIGSCTLGWWLRQCLSIWSGKCIWCHWVWFFSFLLDRSNPALRNDFVMPGGYENPSESNDRLSWWLLVSWAGYVEKNLHHGIYKSRGFFAPHISKDQLQSLLPSYHRDVLLDEGEASTALALLKDILAISETEIMVCQKWFLFL